MTNLKRATIYGLFAVTALLVVAGGAAAQSTGCTGADCTTLANGNIGMGAAIGAGLAVGLAGIGTGMAQSGIGAAGVGAVAEDPGFIGRAILFLAIPETAVILGVLISFLLIGYIPSL